MKLDDDQKIIKRVVNGDKKAYEELMKKYNVKIYNYILRMVRNEEIAIELTQDFFLKIYRLINTYNFIYKFSTWSYRICYNLVIDYIRKEKVIITSIEDEKIHNKLIKCENYIKDDACDILEMDELKQEVWKVIEIIPIRYRKLILLRYMHNLKYGEIAEITGLPLGTVKNRIFKAKKILKKEAEENGLFD